MRTLRRISAQEFGIVKGGILSGYRENKARTHAR